MSTPESKDYAQALPYVAAAPLYATPIAVLQVLTAVVSRSWLAVALAASGIAFSWALWGYSTAACNRKRTRSLARFLLSIQNSELELIEPARLQRLLSQEQWAEIYRGTLQDKPLRWAGRIADLRTFNVVIVRPSGGDRLIGERVSYQSLLGSTFIFLRDPPERLTAFDTFAFLHEVGHSGKRAASGLYREVAARTGPFNLLWVCLFAPWDEPVSAAAVTLILLGQFVFRYNWDLWPGVAMSTHHLTAEIEADRYAIRGMTTDQLAELRGILSDCPIRDKRLSANPPQRGNEFRNFMLMREIDTVLTTRQRPERDPIQPVGVETLLGNACALIGLLIVGQRVTAWKLGVVVPLVVALVWLWLRTVLAAERQLYAIERWIQQPSEPTANVR